MSTALCEETKNAEESHANEVKSLLDRLWELLDGEAENIQTYILGEQKEKYGSDVFECVYKFETLTDRPRNIRARHGVYVFMIKQPVELDKKRVSIWNSIPNAGFKLFNQESLVAGDCLYVGSCISNSLYRRMTQHFGEKEGLQLRHVKRDFMSNSVCVYAFVMNKKFEDYERNILPFIEKRLHDYMKPKTGSSRT